jgi:hypothetical protein
MKTMKNDPKYPFVRCDAHPGEDEPGYAVCQHVLNGAPVAHYKLANPERLGEVLCAPCGAEWNRPGRVFDVKLLILCCAHSVRESSWDHVAVQ